MEVGSVFSGQAVQLSGLTDILSRLNIGDVIRAQIIEFTSNELILKLFDGTTLTAATAADIDAKQGDYVDFTVKGKNEDQLVLETVKKPAVNSGEDQDTGIKKQLVNLEISPSKEAVEIAKELKANHLPVTKEMVGKAFDLVVKLKELSITKAVFFAGNGLEANENNIGRLNNLVEKKLGIAAQIGTLLKDLSAVEESVSLDQQRGTAENIPAPGNQSGKGLHPEASSDKTNIVTRQDTFDKNGVLNLIQSQAEKTENQFLKGLLNVPGIQEKITDFITQSKGSQAQLTEKVKVFINEELKLLAPSEKKLVEDFIDDIGRKLRNNRIETLGSTIDYKEVREGLRKELEDIFIKLDSGQLDKDLDAAKLYKNLVERLDVIKESVSQSNLPGKTELLNKLDNLAENVRFMNQINQHSTYIQLPLSMNGHQTTGELYLLKRDQRRRRINPENVTMFVSLGTQNLGQVESLIGINKKNVSMNMRLENQEIIDFIKENYKELYQALMEKGYKLVDVKYRLLDEPADILNINKVADKELSRNRISIDYRL